MADHERNLLQRWEAHLELVRRSMPELAESCRLTPVEVAPYEDVLRLAGFRLPASFAAALRVGSVSLPRVRSLGLGVELCTPEEIFANHIHALAERAAGVSQGGAWLVFATEHGDLEPAYAFDRRFVDASGEVEVGGYHQDTVCHEPLGPTDHLPNSAPSYDQWLVARLAEYERALSSEEGRREIQAIVDRDPPSPPRPAERWEAVWERYADFSAWPKRYWAGYREVLRETTDESVAEAIAARVDRELRGKGERVVPGLSSDLERGWWTTGLPGPTDLAMRLPDAARLGFVRFALKHCGVEPESEALRAGWAELEDRIAGDATSDPSIRHACADEGWTADIGEPETARHRFAQALGWALGPMTSARLGHVLALAHGIRREVVGDNKLAMHRLWSRLRKIQRGQPVSDHLVAPQPKLDETVSELAAWLESFEGPQRAQLEAFERDWLPRLRALAPELSVHAKRLVRKRIKSKKIAAARDALLATLPDVAG